MPLEVLPTKGASLLTNTPNARLLQQLHELLLISAAKKLGVRLRTEFGCVPLSALEHVSDGVHDGRYYSRFTAQAQAQSGRLDDVTVTVTLVVDRVTYADR